MTDLQIFIPLAVIYLVECVRTVRSGTTAFISIWGTDWRATRPVVLARASGVGLVLGNPFPPLGMLHTCRPWPLSLSPTGIHYRPIAGSMVDQEPVLVSWEQLESTVASDKSLRLNGTLVAKFDTQRSALRCVDWLQQVRATDVTAREELIRRRMQTTLDTGAIVTRLAESQKASWLLRILCNMLFALWFVALPVVLRNKGIVHTWPWLLGSIALGSSLVLISYVRTLDRLHPETRYKAGSGLLQMILSPLGIIRSADHLSRDVLDEFHPLAVAKVLCTPEAFASMARREYARSTASHPLAEQPGAGSEESADVWRRFAWRTQLEAFFAREGVSIHDIMSPPMQREPASRSYCPLCLAQYTLEEGTCSDCGDMKLTLFDS